MGSPITDLYTYRSSLELPVIGMESEFNVFVDGREIVPEEVWRHPSDFISDELLRRTSKSSQLPTGGALYFDRGVIEVVTPVIELAPECTSRMVRSIWEQISYVRANLTTWQQREGRHVRLKAYSSHYNISYEIPRDQRSSDRTIQKLALLLAHLLPVPVMLLGANRRSTGVGVRPRRDRIEVTHDFTPDAGMTLATAAVIVGIVRDVITWDSYRIDKLHDLELPAGVEPGRHTTRKGWLTKDVHFPRSPFSADIDAEVWATTHGNLRSLRQIGLALVERFLPSIRAHSDEFSTQLALAVLEGRSPSLLDLDDRPIAYEDVGRMTRWGGVIAELENYADGRVVAGREWGEEALVDYLLTRLAARRRFLELGDETVAMKKGDEDDEDDATPYPHRRSADLHTTSTPPWNAADVDRRQVPVAPSAERRRSERRRERPSGETTSPSRSDYERVFMNLAARKPLLSGSETLVPVAIKGWYEAIFRSEGEDEEKVIAIDELRRRLHEWI